MAERGDSAADSSDTGSTYGVPRSGCPWCARATLDMRAATGDPIIKASCVRHRVESGSGGSVGFATSRTRHIGAGYLPDQEANI